MSEIESGLTANAGSGLSQLLFGPVFLIGEIIGTLLPGIFFCFGLFWKGYRQAFAPFELNFLGYRTRVIVFIFVAYLVGKILTAPLRVLFSSARFEDGRIKKQKEGTVGLYLLLGAVAVPTLVNKPRLVDYVLLLYSAISFSFGTGLALLILALIPGAAVGLRALLLSSGLVLLWESWSGLKTVETAAQISAGYVIQDFLSKFPATTWPALFKVWEALRVQGVLGKTDQTATKGPNA